MILSESLFGSNLSILELLWMLVAVAAIFLANSNRKAMKADMLAMGQERRNGRYRMARGNWRREVVRIAVHGIFLGIGILAAFTPNNPNPTLLSMLFGVLLIMASSLLAYNSWADGRDDRYFRKYLSMETELQVEDRLAGEDRRGGYLSAQERSANAAERMADAHEVETS